jgi:uncharacterized membrane protein (DUF373 family)
MSVSLVHTLHRIYCVTIKPSYCYFKLELEHIYHEILFILILVETILNFVRLSKKSITIHDIIAELR